MMNKACKYKLTREEELKLFSNLNEEAKERICESMVGIVKNFAKKWKIITEGSYEDCEGLCWLAVMEAINKYDPHNEYGACFNTYAYSAILGRLRRYRRDHFNRIFPADTFSDVICHMQNNGVSEQRSLDDYIESNIDLDDDVRYDLKIHRLEEHLKEKDNDLLKIFKHRLNSLPQTEIAKKTGISQVTVSRKLAKIKKIYNEFE